MRIRKLYNGTGPTGDPKKKKPITPAVANPLLAPKYLLSDQDTFNTVNRIVDAIESGQDVTYDPKYSNAIAEERKSRQRQRMITEPVDYTGRVQSTAPVAEFLSPAGDLLAAGEGAGMVAQGVKEGDLSKIGMGSGLALGAVGMAFLPGSLSNFRAAAEASDNRVLYHIHDIIEDSQRANADLTPDMVFGQIEAGRYNAAELADAADQIDRFITMADDPNFGLRLSNEERTNLNTLYDMLEHEGDDGLFQEYFNTDGAGISDSGVPFARNRMSPDQLRLAMRQFEELPPTIQRRVEEIENDISFSQSTPSSRQAQEEIFSILENHYGGNIPEEIALDIGVHPSQMPEGWSPPQRSIIADQYGIPGGGQTPGVNSGNLPMTFRDKEVQLPKTVSHFQVRDRITKTPYGPNRSLGYDSRIQGNSDGIDMSMSPLGYVNELTQSSGKYASFYEAYPDSYLAKISLADTRHGREIASLLDEAKERLAFLEKQPSTLVSPNDLREARQAVRGLEEAGPTTSRDVYAMMTKLFDEIKTGDIVDPGSLSTDSYGMWLRQIDKGNKYLTQGGKKQGAKLIPEDKVPASESIKFQPLNKMGEFTNAFKLPKEMAELFNRYGILTGQGSSGPGLRTHLMNEGMTVDDINAMMMKAKYEYIDPALKKRGLPPVEIGSAGNADMYPGTQDPIFFKFPLPYLEKLYKGGRIKLLKKAKKGMKVKKAS